GGVQGVAARKEVERGLSVMVSTGRFRRMRGRAAHPETRHRKRRLGAVSTRSGVAVERLDVSSYEIPTDEPESDATLEWDSTTIVVVKAHAGEATGLGYTYAPAAAGKLVEEKLADEVSSADALAPAEAYEQLGRALRNAGRPGIG